jgi:hypothetical protein
MNNTNKRVFATAELMTPEFQEVTKSLTFDDWDDTMSMTVRFGLDGEFAPTGISFFFC